MCLKYWSNIVQTLFNWTNPPPPTQIHVSGFSLPNTSSCTARPHTWRTSGWGWAVSIVLMCLGSTYRNAKVPALHYYLTPQQTASEIFLFIAVDDERERTTLACLQKLTVTRHTLLSFAIINVEDILQVSVYIYCYDFHTACIQWNRQSQQMNRTSHNKHVSLPDSDASRKYYQLIQKHTNYNTYTNYV